MPLGATVCMQEGQLPADAHSLYLSNEGNTPKAGKCRAGEQSAPPYSALCCSCQLWSSMHNRSPPEPSNLRCEGDGGEDGRRALATGPCHRVVPSNGSKWTPSGEGQKEGSCWAVSQCLPTECCLLQPSILPLPARQM